MLVHADFHAAMLAEPHLTQPARHYAAFLHLLGHPQAQAWRLHCALRYSAEADDLDAPGSPSLNLGTLLEQFTGRCRLRLQCACLAVRYTPLGDGRRTGDLLHDDRSAQALVRAELHALRLAEDSQFGRQYLLGVAGLVQDRNLIGAPPGAYAVARAARSAVLSGNPRDGQNHMLQMLNSLLQAVEEVATHNPQVASAEAAVQAALGWQAELLQCLLPSPRAVPN